MNQAQPADMVIVGRIGGAHGLRGWLRLRSFTEPEINLCRYAPLWLRTAQGWSALSAAKIKDESSAGRTRLLIQLPGIRDRDAAQQHKGFELGVRAKDLPPAEPDSFYWRELIGLAALAPNGDHLGQIKGLLDSPAHSVLVVELTASTRERLAQKDSETLVPFVSEFTQEIDLAEKTIVIDWPEVFFPGPENAEVIGEDRGAGDSGGS